MSSFPLSRLQMLIHRAAKASCESSFHPMTMFTWKRFQFTCRRRFENSKLLKFWWINSKTCENFTSVRSDTNAFVLWWNVNSTRRIYRRGWKSLWMNCYVQVLGWEESKHTLNWKKQGTRVCHPNPLHWSLAKALEQTSFLKMCNPSTSVFSASCFWNCAEKISRSRPCLSYFRWFCQWTWLSLVHCRWRVWICVP